MPTDFVSTFVYIRVETKLEPIICLAAPFIVILGKEFTCIALNDAYYSRLYLINSNQLKVLPDVDANRDLGAI